MILVIRTDKPEAEIGLFDDGFKLTYEIWTAHRQLAETIHHKIRHLLESKDKAQKDIAAIIAYKGPGSFTGLRIGLSVANALAVALGIPIVGTSGSSWIEEGVENIKNGKNDIQVLPDYGAPVHITLQKK